MALNLIHLYLVHGNDLHFSIQCGIHGCSYTGRSFSALYSHIYYKHPDSGVIQKHSKSERVQQSASNESVTATPATVSIYESEQLCDAGTRTFVNVHLQANPFATNENFSTDIQADLDLLGRDKVVQQCASALFLLKLMEHRSLASGY